MEDKIIDIKLEWKDILSKNIEKELEVWLDSFGDTVDPDKKEILEITYKFFSGKDYQETPTKKRESQEGTLD